jgi:hypothetical protein
MVVALGNIEGDIQDSALSNTAPACQKPNTARVRLQDGLTVSLNFVQSASNVPQTLRRFRGTITDRDKILQDKGLNSKVKLRPGAGVNDK